MKKGGGTTMSEARKMPPPFHGPQETIYYHAGFPVEPTQFHTGPKARKSFVEKIGKTLDKLTLNKSQALPPSIASTAAWVYPIYQPRILPASYYIQPWTEQNGFYGTENFFEYPVTSPPATRNNAYCACYDNLHGTVRRRSQNKCKQCSLKAAKKQESALKKLANVNNANSPNLRSENFKKFDFNVTNRLNKKVEVAQDEWQSYWEQEEDFTQHLKVSEDKTLPKSEISTEEVNKSSESDVKPNLTTFACLKEAENEQKSPEKTEEPILNAELKEFVKQRYAKRYRSKFPRRKSSNIIDEVIIEESEEALKAEENGEEIDLKTDEMMMLKLKRKKGVTFSPEPVKPKVIERIESSSEDELTGYCKVVVSQNLAEEILDEIYGKIEENSVKYENSVVSESGAIEAPLHDNSKSLADEILDELYGPKIEENNYEVINEAGQKSPALKELAKRFTKHQKGSKKVSGKSLRSKVAGTLTESSSMSNLFNDTTRLRLNSRPSLTNIFSHEAPVLTRPKEPPPPPPPVEPVLLPVTPPRKFFPLFTTDELKRINSVINGKNEDTETIDEFSSDEFSEDEFDDNATYENLNVYDSVPDLAMEEDSLEEKMSFGPEYGESPLPMTSTPVQFKSLVEKASEKTIIFTSQKHESLKDEILISSSSWINLQGHNNFGENNEVEKINDNIMVNSNSIGISGNLAVAKVEPLETFDSLEPVRPPRLKKMAKLQKMEAEKFQATKDSLDAHLKLKFEKISKPEISSPVLLNSTFNPNDMEAHKSLMLKKSKNTENSNKITFKDIKRYASTSLASLSSNLRQVQLGKSSFYYEADNSQDSIYEEATKRVSPTYSEHIYEEIPDHNRNEDRPLPPIPESSKDSPKRRHGSIFEGASKYEILHYLKDAKDRIGHGDFDMSDLDETYLKRNHNHRVSAISNLSDSSDDSGSVLNRLKIADIERTDSGVGSETSKSSKASVEIRRAPSLSKSSDSGSGSGHDLGICPDCEQDLSDNEVICKRCLKRRAERKEIITEIAETEAKYGRDLRIIVEEFYRPMLVAGLLSSDQLAAIFLNADELIQVNAHFSEVLREAIEMAYDSGDEDLTAVNVGKLFLDSLSMLRAFESYCTRQASASLLLTTLEKERELLRIFLKVSQMENSMLRRMNLSSFLMVPVQRVTKYPLLLSRLYKVTPSHHSDKNDIKLAQDKIEAALEQMNKDAKDVVNSSKLWKRLQPMMSSSGNNSPSKKSDSDDLSSFKLRKTALEILGWNSDEARFPLEGRILFTQPNDANWKKVWTVKMSPIQALLCVLSPEELPEVTSNKELIFPPDSSTIKDASLIMVREKNAKYTLVRDPLPLENCVICCEQDWDDCFEVQEFVSKDSYVFKGEEPEDTMMWFKTLQFYTQCLGGWRKRRKGLGNIMIDPNLVSAAASITLEETTEGASAAPKADNEN